MTRLFALLLLVCFAAGCAAASSRLRTDFQFGPEDETALLLIDVDALGDIRDRPIMRIANLDTGVFGVDISVAPVQSSLLDPQAEDAPLLSARPVPARTFALIGIRRFNVPAARADCFDDRAPVFSLEPGTIGVLSLGAIGLDREAENDGDAALRAAREALRAFPEIEGEPVLLEPVAFIEFPRFALDPRGMKSLCLSGKTFDIVE